MKSSLLQTTLSILATLSFNVLLSKASPYPAPEEVIAARAPYEILERTTPTATPVFPDQPPSCPICAAKYDQINSCAQACPVLANATMIIFNPGAFIDVIKCACTETFESVFPQCVDCFQQTNQTDVLDTPDLPAVVSGMRKVCALASTLLGNVSASDGEVTSGTPTPTGEPSPTGSNGATQLHAIYGTALGSFVLAALISFQNVL